MMTNFMLVHGAWLRAWCWDGLAAELNKAGHGVRTPELPGHGKDQTLVSSISLDSYVETVASELVKVPGKLALLATAWQAL